MKKTTLLLSLILMPFLTTAQNGEDTGYSRHANSSVYGLNINAPTNTAGTGLDYGTYTNMQLAQRAWSGSHAILFNAFASQNPIAGSLRTTGNTKYANDEGGYTSGAGAIMFFGNAGIMDFFITPPSTGQNTDIDWGMPNMRMLRNGNIGIGTDDPGSKLHVFDGNSSGSAHSYSKLTVEHSNHAMISILTPSDKTAYFGFADADDQYVGGMQYEHANDRMVFRVNDHASDMVINDQGNVGIGTTNPDTKLAVNGTVHAKEVKVDLNGWPDFVFKKDYPLPTLTEVEAHIKANGHLKDIPSEAEVKANGIHLGEMDAKLLQKIEELMLYTIEQQKLIENQTEQLSKQQQEIQTLKKENEALQTLSKEVLALKEAIEELKSEN